VLSGFAGLAAVSLVVAAVQVRRAHRAETPDSRGDDPIRQKPGQSTSVNASQVDNVVTIGTANGPLYVGAQVPIPPSPPPRAPAFLRFVPLVQSPHMTHERKATLVGQVKEPERRVNRTGHLVHFERTPGPCCTPCEDIRAMLKNGKAPPAGAGGANTSCSGFLTGPRPPFALLPD
jgi:hypothetical protein